MVQETMKCSKAKEELEGLLAQALSGNLMHKEVSLEPAIDSLEYQDVNLAYMMLAKTATKAFKDIELLHAFNNKNDPMKMLKALLAADAYLDNKDYAALKETIKNAALEGDFNKVLDYITMHNHGAFDEKKIDEMLEARISELMADPTKNLEGNVYKFEKIEGDLGTGLKVISKDHYFEHRSIGKNYTLRIMKEGEGYKAVLHVSRIDPKNDYQSCLLFYNICKEVFSFEAPVDCASTKNVLKGFQKGKKSKRLYFNECPKGGPVSLYFNAKDNHPYFLENNLYCNKRAEEIISWSLAVVSPLLLIPGLVVPVPALTLQFPLIFPLVVTNLSRMDQKYEGFVQNGVIKQRLKKYKEKYLNDENLLEEFVKAYSRHVEAANKGQEDDSRIEAQTRLNNIKETFRDISYSKGFVAEFKSNSLDDLYIKGHALIQKLKQIN